MRFVGDGHNLATPKSPTAFHLTQGRPTALAMRGASAVAALPGTMFLAENDEGMYRLQKGRLTLWAVGEHHEALCDLEGIALDPTGICLDARRGEWPAGEPRHSGLPTHRPRTGSDIHEEHSRKIAVCRMNGDRLARESVTAIRVPNDERPEGIDFVTRDRLVVVTEGPATVIPFRVTRG